MMNHPAPPAPAPHPLLALLLGFLPGAGHAYLRKFGRMVLYGLSFWGPALLLLLVAVSGNLGGNEVLLVLFPLLIWVVSMIDLLGTTLSAPSASSHAYEPGPIDGIGIPSARLVPTMAAERQREKTAAILLALVPGLGHMYLGLMQRGVAFLISFVGLGVFVVFVAIVLSAPAFLLFLLLLPILWIYAMFDAVHLVQRKHAGEPLADRSLFEELEGHFASGHKNKMAAAALSFLPGAGHLYLGLQKRGLQLMGLFLVSIYLMDSLRMTLFLFLLPLVWLYAFFDAIQQHGRFQRGELADVPVMTELSAYHRWIGAALIAVGAFFLADRFVMPLAAEHAPRIYSLYQTIRYNLPAAVTAFLLLALGLRMLLGRPNPPEPMPLHEAPDSIRRPEPLG
ncbi:hypothetical protein HGI30_14380 [Paenibacillus albicereus]|uniref:Multi-tm2 domain protein n=1 Tax=Paenibacillus albicereus TaxID=2726185 RepID=A0A6H2GZ05_9BACL|nr:hypothetical protein [Paenibacillus albicereus]QJC52635.1 hypothetical protein HGI30_14380 [Paenibacillus albicereus]